MKRKPKTIERHHDDCGDDLRGLGDSSMCKCGDIYSSSSDEDQGVPLMQGDGSGYLPTYWFEPKLASWDDLQMRASEKFLFFSHMLALTTYLLTLDDGDNVRDRWWRGSHYTSANTLQ